jgi:hypothetical protein
MKAYKENEKYIFISYSHKDNDTILPIIENMQEEGFRVWFDEGIDAYAEYPQYIEEKIEGASAVLVFMTNNAAASKQCKNEINYAIILNKEILIVYIEETKLSLGMEFLLVSLQSMFKYRHRSEAEFLEKLCEARILQSCRGENIKKQANLKRKDGKIVYKDEKTEVLRYGVTEIGKSTYEGNKDIVGVVLPKSITSIGVTAFCCCTNLESIVIPDSVTEISEGAFTGCKCLTGITLPQGIEFIDAYAFFYCESLAEITIPDGVRSIGASAFAGCKKLLSVTIPNSVTSIGDSAFAGCNNLKDIYYRGSKYEWNRIQIFKDGNKKLIGPYERADIHFNCK